MLACGEVCPDALSLRGCCPDRGRAADARVIAADHGKNFDPAHIAVLQDARGRSDIGKYAALSGGDNHELEILRALLVDAACERGCELHLGRSRAHAAVSVGDRLIGYAREPAQDLDLLRRL